MNGALPGLGGAQQLDPALQRALASMVEKSGATRSAMTMSEAALPPLRVVTIVENPKVAEKEVDASNLPYLHRNPAV